MAAAAPSTIATAAGTPAHAKVQLGGPVYVFLQFIGYAAVLGAVAVTIDSLRRPAVDFGGNSARRWMWAGPQLLLLALIALAWGFTLAGFGRSATLATLVGFLAIYLFFCVMLQIAYLLVVVFPRRREPIPAEVEDELPKE